MRAEYLTKFHIKKEDAEVVAPVQKEVPKDLKYHLSVIESAVDGGKIRQWIKTRVGTLLKQSIAVP